jgi:hypothetical protein
VEFSVFSETLKKLFWQTFTIEARIVLVAEHEEIRHFIEYFSLPSSHQFYINDIAFQNKNHTVIDPKKIQKNTILIFPIFGKDGCIWVLELGTKPLWDFYTKKRQWTFREKIA